MPIPKEPQPGKSPGSNPQEPINLPHNPNPDIIIRPGTGIPPSGEPIPAKTPREVDKPKRRRKIKPDDNS